MLCSMVRDRGFDMRTRIGPFSVAVLVSVAVLAMVAASCGGSGDSGFSPDDGSIDTATTAMAADTTVPGSSDATPPTTDLPAADPTAPSSDDPSVTTDLHAVDASVPSTDDPTPSTTEPAAPGPLVLEPEQLAELSLTGEVVGELMGAELVEVESGSLFMLLVDPVPPGTVVDAHDYWSLDSGDRSLGVGSVDYASVIMLLLAAEADVGPMFDQITNAEPVYTSWVPVTVRGAVVAEQSVAIPYEGEPDDEPEFDAILARRDRLIVAATVSGSDADARVATAVDLVELVLERALELSG